MTPRGSVERPPPHNLTYDSEEPDRPLTAAEEQLVAKLTPDDLATIDEALLERAGERWRKVAFLVAHALHTLEARWPLLPEVYYGRRIRELVDQGVLESQGDLTRMRFSEVRLRSENGRFADRSRG